ncbi:MAG: LamG domain-containing protein [Bacteroidota bacterium]
MSPRIHPWLLLAALGAATPAARANIVLEYLTGRAEGSHRVVLQWRTLSEANNWGFEVQRSANGQTSYADVPGSFVPAGPNPTIPQDYGFADTLVAPGTWYYRLRQIDLSGERHYTYGILVHVGVPYQYAADSSSGLLLHMDETSGTLVNDAGPGGNHGQAWGTSIVDARFGKGRVFVAGGDRVRVPDGPSLRPPLLTAEAWVYAADLASVPSAVILEKRAGSGRSFALGLAGSSGRVVFAAGGGPGDTAVSTRALTPGAWHHVAGTSDGTTLTLYLNGREEAAVPQAGPLPFGGEGLFAGSDSGGARVWQGIVDEVRISDRARTPAEFNLRAPVEGLAAAPSGMAMQLSWTDGGGGVPLLRYRIYRGADSSGMGLLDSTRDALYTDNATSPMTTYYYRVQPVDSSGYENFMSDVVWGTTSADAPTLLLPPDGGVLSSDTALCVWSPPVTAVSAYWFEVSTDSLFAGSTVDSTVTDTFAVARGLIHRADYWWRVRGRGPSAWGTFSSPRCFSIEYTVEVPVLGGWNLVSNPVERADDTLRSLFPTALFDYAFAFEGSAGYIQSPVLEEGRGYWVKFPEGSTQDVQGGKRERDTVSLSGGWNIVGTLSIPLDTADIRTEPPGLVLTPFYGFPGYDPAPVLEPGKSYWVKLRGAGLLYMGAGAAPPRREHPRGN